MAVNPRDNLSIYGKRLVSEIIFEHSKYYEPINSDLVGHLVALLCLNPTRKVLLEDLENRELAGAFIKECLAILRQTDSPLIKTLELQVGYFNNRVSYESAAECYEERVNEKTAQLKDEIIQFDTDDPSELEKLFQKIVIYVIIHSYQGKSTNEQVVLEAKNALKSVLSKDDLLDFLKRKRRSRISMLTNLQEIVCGIRIFNKDAGHCGEGVRDIISDVTAAYKNTKDHLNSIKYHLTKHISAIETAIRRYLKTEYENTLPKIKLVLSNTIKKEDLNYVDEVLILLRQREQYLKESIEYLYKMKKGIDHNIDKLKSTLRLLHETVGHRIAVAIEKVFPHFTTLGQVWRSLMNYLFVFIEINAQVELLGSIARTDYSLYRQIMHKIEKISEDEGKLDFEKNTLHEIMIFEKCTLNTFHTNLPVTTLTKFCAYTLIKKNFLIQSQQRCGVVIYENFYFGFSELEFAITFAKNVVEYIRLFYETLLHKYQLIVFFNLYEEMRITDIFYVVEEEESASKLALPTSQDIDIQTELHPIPYFYDKNYTWNIWDYRRKAIQLGTIRRCRTHSAQTNSSLFREDVRIQTVSQSENGTQTLTESSINTVPFWQLAKFPTGEDDSDEEKACTNVEKAKRECN